mmetsp:Transcript_4492/g.16975  ORF Transcript_4492/g.16975 Transcript_4492/m.16975 type:complete len:214 (-) Transcript_4492:2363-3004(-)|eukprot:CAMPEP_0117454578 /NCGR_PEP_ID=MMETSP0759-20121206/10872_1 /TAXON_ID=63605 /ORGANISM="Percolomonas cosmopolitus, Strain WS" /LENGTH=213 /DNA_ID=CAMNT_0005247767 /DNA_START=47 /DNA_END=688 /DNA_ORIENTATION=+
MSTENDNYTFNRNVTPDFSENPKTAKATQGKNRFPPSTIGDLIRNPHRHSEKCVNLYEEFQKCRENYFHRWFGYCQKPYKLVKDCLGEEFEFHRRQNRAKGKNTRVLLDTLREQRREHRWKELAHAGEEAVGWNSLSERLLMESKRAQLRQQQEYFSHEDITKYDWDKYVDNLDKKEEEFRREEQSGGESEESHEARQSLNDDDEDATSRGAL